MASFLQDGGPIVRHVPINVFIEDIREKALSKRIKIRHIDKSI